ncbi:MAG: pyridoxal phosphate-dependent aminotransferase [Candidatus Xenobiia bacterium LiM19]
MDIHKVVKPHIQTLHRTKDTMDDRLDYLRLDKNERLLPFNHDLFEQFKSSIRSEHLSAYHELGSLYRKLSSFLMINENEILLTAGGDLAIKTVYEVCVKAGDNVIIHAPSYAMHKVYAHMFQAELRFVNVDENFYPDIEEMLRKIDKKTKLFVMENPNGFVGTPASIEKLEYCAKNLIEYDILLFIDEAYYYIQNKEPHVESLIRKYPNIVICQTFSKAHGLAGSRVGYIAANQNMMQYLSNVRPVHEITGLSAFAAEWVIDHPEIINEYTSSIKVSKQFLFQELEKQNLHFKDTAANFILVFLPDEGRTKALRARLRNHKILIRRPFEESYLNGWTRVCVGSLDDSVIFINALKHELK